MTQDISRHRGDRLSQKAKVRVHFVVQLENGVRLSEEVDLARAFSVLWWYVFYGFVQ